MTDRPIIFSAPMIQALIDGRKSQTMRLIKPHNSLFNGGGWPKWAKAANWDWNAAWVDEGPSPAGNPGPYLKLPYLGAGEWAETVHRIYPAIQPGDRFWVKEAHAIRQCLGQTYLGSALAYRADVGAKKSPLTYLTGPTVDVRWRPSIHMPRWASRLTMTVTDVRVQRVQDISEADAIAEGMIKIGCLFGIAGAYHSLAGYGDGDPRQVYRTLWNHLHGAGAWDRNDWGAAYTFDVARGNIDQIGGAA